jgi:hypothetical protein
VWMLQQKANLGVDMIMMMTKKKDERTYMYPQTLQEDCSMFVEFLKPH